MNVKTIPDGYTAVTPYLVVEDAAGLIEFVTSAFGAKVKERMEEPDGTVRHAEVELEGAKIMIGQPRGANSATKSMLYVYVNDCDGYYQRALEAGGRSVTAPADMFYGDRNAGIEDKWGNQWWIAQHKEDVSPEELKRRMAVMARKA